MQKRLIGHGIAIIEIAAIVFLLISCASTTAVTPVVESNKPNAVSTSATDMADLDGAIKQASDDINNTIPSGTKVALLNFSSSSDAFSDYVIEEMSTHLVRGRKLVVVDRREIDLIRNEMKFQLSGEVSDESAQEIGRLLGAQFIISGSLASMGDSYRFRTKVINVISAAIEAASSIRVSDCSQIQHLLAQSNRTSVPPPVAISAPAQTTAPEAIPALSSSPPPTVTTPAVALPPATQREERTRRTESEQMLLTTGMLTLDAGTYFYIGRSDIHINVRPHLTAIAQMLVKYPKLRIEVGGHMDNAGRLEANMNLSQQRAEAVVVFMVGVEPQLSSMLTARGYGPTMPKADNTTAAGREMNRRVELKVLNPEVLKEYNP